MSEADTDDTPTDTENDTPEHIKERKEKEEERKKKVVWDPNLEDADESDTTTA
jgi:hypothetical protein